MDRLAHDIEVARDALTPRWDSERAERLYRGLARRRRHRIMRRAGVTSVVVGAVALALTFMPTLPSSRGSGERAGEPASETATSSGAVVQGTVRDAHRLRLADGSVAQLFGHESELEIEHNAPDHIGVKLHAGRAHFEVVPDALRSFEVAAGPYRVVVIGTVFEVERDASHVAVSVGRGKVRVYGPHGAQDLVAGQRQTFDIVQPGQQGLAPADEVSAADDDAEEEGADAVEEPSRSRARSGKRTRQPSWRSLSQSGDYDAAFEHLRRGGEVEDDDGALMDAADAARLSGHPESAVKYLERVVRDHASSPVAPLAAFTLGRVYLDRLGQPHKAAKAFERARALAPTGSLAQDALAREVEALSKGGEAQEANVRAHEYLRRYPEGRRVRAVQLYGGIE